VKKELYGRLWSSIALSRYIAIWTRRFRGICKPRIYDPVMSLPFSLVPEVLSIVDST